jgi:hypothetical protein
MYSAKISPLVAPLLFFGLVLARAADLPDKFDPAEFSKPVCPASYRTDPETGGCSPDVEQIRKLDRKACEASKFEFTQAAGGKPAECKVGTAPTPGPTCKALPGHKGAIEGSGKDAACVYTRVLSTSSPADYEGDCFNIKAAPEGSTLAPGKTYKVTAQTPVDGNDKLLTVYEAAFNRWPLPFMWGCDSRGGKKHQVLASAILDTGSTREGYAYGLLTMPYKYFPGSKSFVEGVPIGAYIGWRSGTAGSGMTVAAALTLGTVKANTIDPDVLDANGKPKVTGTTDVAALSGAIGLMFDISKARGARPFKVGAFVGQDRVNMDRSIDYKHNRKTWVAVQIGFDFTDN